MADRITIGNAEIVFALDMVPPPRSPDAFFEGVTAKDWVPYEDVLEEGQIQLYYFSFAPAARRYWWTQVWDPARIPSEGIGLVTC